jgi:hypothetical protein
MNAAEGAARDSTEIGPRLRGVLPPRVEGRC